MANRRLFSREIVRSDAFLDMPLSSQALYFQLGMEADDDGFIANAKTIARLVNANPNDLDLLIAKNFLIKFENGVVVVKHWLINNSIRSDRYKPTTHGEEKALLFIKENGAYTMDGTQGKPLIETSGIPLVAKRLPSGCPKLSKDKLSKDKSSKDNLSEVERTITSFTGEPTAEAKKQAALAKLGFTPEGTKGSEEDELF